MDVKIVFIRMCRKTISPLNRIRLAELAMKENTCQQ